MQRMGHILNLADASAAGRGSKMESVLGMGVCACAYTRVYVYLIMCLNGCVCIAYVCVRMDVLGMGVCACAYTRVYVYLIYVSE